MFWLLSGCFDAPPESAAPAPPPPPVVDHEPGCDTPESCTAACDAGGATACNRLGLWLHDGLAGAPRDPVAASERYARACDLGAGIGCFNLAEQKSGGQGIPADPAGAAALMARAHAAYRASCDAGGLVWCTNLAGLYQRGEGVPRDPVAALNLYVSTCEKGEPFACLEQASMWSSGAAGAPDPAGAEALLRRLCDGGLAEGCNNLALKIEEQGGDPRPIFQASCDRGTAMSCRNLALRTEDVEAALALLIRACDDTSDLDGVACAMAGDLLEAGQRAGEAFLRFERACSVGVPEACLAAVRLGATGAVPLTPEAARPLVERGCALGDPEACDVIRSINPGVPTP